MDIITGQGKGGVVQVFSGSPSNTLLGSFTAYDGKVRGGVRVAAGDINGDFLDDIVTVPGKGMPAQVLAFNATTVNAPNAIPLVNFVADPGKKGLFIAVGDVSGDGTLDFVLGSGKGAAPEVRVFDGNTLAPLGNLFGRLPAFPSKFKGGVSVAVGDVNGNGTTDIVVGSGKGKPTTVRVFDPSGAGSGPFLEFMPYGPKDKRGVFVGALGR
jgi:hypothetical protein